MAPDEISLALNAQPTASRFIASVLFWVASCVGAFLMCAVATFVLEIYDRGYGQASSFSIGLVLGVCTSSLNAIAFAVVLAVRAPIARRSAGRLYLAAAGMALVALVLSTVAAPLLTIASGSEAMLLFVPPAVSAIVSYTLLHVLVRSEWLHIPIAGACTTCGYTVSASHSGRCPECGRPAR